MGGLSSIAMSCLPAPRLRLLASLHTTPLGTSHLYLQLLLGNLVLWCNLLAWLQLALQVKYM